MIIVIPYIYTSGSEKFKQFLMLPFTIDMLYPIYNEKSCNTLFDNWRGKDMINWYRFINDDKIILEFYPTYYVLRKDGSNEIKYTLSLPKTINDFINDMYRFSIQLYWTEWIDLNFEPKDYLDVDGIKAYYVDLLQKISKSHELL